MESIDLLDSVFRSKAVKNRLWNNELMQREEEEGL